MAVHFGRLFSVLFLWVLVCPVLSSAQDSRRQNTQKCRLLLKSLYEGPGPRWIIGDAETEGRITRMVRLLNAKPDTAKSLLGPDPGKDARFYPPGKLPSQERWKLLAVAHSKLPLEMFKKYEKQAEIIQRIKDNLSVTEQDIQELRGLLVDLSNLKVKATALQLSADSTGSLPQLVYDYFKNQEPLIKQQFLDKKAGENLFLVVPELDTAKGTVKLGQRKYDDYAVFKRFLDDLENQAKKSTKWQVQMDQYMDGYLPLRWVQTSFSFMDDENFKANVDPHLLPDLIKIRETLEQGFKADSPIHPRVEDVEYAGQLHAARKWWARSKKILPWTLGMVAGGSWLLSRREDVGKAKALYNDVTDRANIMNTDYWIQLCSAQPNQEALVNCIIRFDSLLSEHFAPITERKKQLDQDYTGSEEALERFKLSSFVAGEVTRRNANSIYQKAMIQYIVEYAGQGAYNHLKMLAAQEEERLKAKNEKKVDSPPVVSEKKLEELVFEKVSRRMQTSRMVYEKEIQNLGSSPSVDQSKRVMERISELSSFETLLGFAASDSADPKLREAIEQKMKDVVVESKTLERELEQIIKGLRYDESAVQ